MNPLAVEIWLSMALAYFFVSITIFAVARFSPLEWQEQQLHSNNSNGNVTNANVCDDHKHEAQQFPQNDHDHHSHHCDDEDPEDCNKFLFDSITQKQYMKNQNNRNHDHHHSHTHHACESVSDDESNLFNNESDLLHDYPHLYWNMPEHGGPCRHHNATELICLKNDFTLKNSFWFTLGTLLQQGSDLNPKVKDDLKYVLFLICVG
jgi:hypothetical protein